MSNLHETKEICHEEIEIQRGTNRLCAAPGRSWYESGRNLPSACGVSQATFFSWKKKFGNMGVSELHRLRQLEEENTQLKKLVADLSIDRQMLQDVIKKNLRPKVKKELVRYIMMAYQVSIRRACTTLPMQRSAFYYKPHRQDEKLLVMRMIEVAFTRIRYGFRRIEVMLRRDGFTDNHKRMHRVFREQGLNLRTKRPRRSRMAAHRLERPEISRVHQVWSMDIAADQFFDGAKFKVLTIVDNYSKKSQLLFVGKCIKSVDVVRSLNKAAQREGCVPGICQQRCRIILKKINQLCPGSELLSGERSNA